MRFVYEYLFLFMWLAFVVYWRVMSAGVKASTRVEAAGSRLVRAILIVGGSALLILPRVPVAFLERRFIRPSEGSFWIGAAITAAGLSFCFWARRHLGHNWSSEVTLKENHELITSGPYALVRHPIYTGLLFALIGSALARGEWRGVLGVALIFAALWFKLRLEERWMREQFGPAYEAYSRKVAALVPYLV